MHSSYSSRASQKPEEFKKQVESCLKASEAYRQLLDSYRPAKRTI